MALSFDLDDTVFVVVVGSEDVDESFSTDTTVDSAAAAPFATGFLDETFVVVAATLLEDTVSEAAVALALDLDDFTGTSALSTASFDAVFAARDVTFVVEVFVGSAVVFVVPDASSTATTFLGRPRFLVITASDIAIVSQWHSIHRSVHETSLCFVLCLFSIPGVDPPYLRRVY